MTRLEFYEQFPGTIIFMENRGWLNLGPGIYTEFQIFNDDTLEFVHNKFGELTEEQTVKYDEYLNIIKILKNDSN
jgi:hypothetical protein